MLIHSFVLTGLVVCAIFGPLSFARGRHLNGAAILALAAVIVVGLVVYRRSRNPLMSSLLTLPAVGGLILYFTATGTAIYSGSMWAFIFPPMAMVSLGRKIGFLITVAFDLMAVTFILWPGMPVGGAEYPLYFQIRFVAVLLAVTAIAFAAERSRERAQQRMLQEIEERKKAEVGLRMAKEQAERSNLAKSDFLSRMSHELRTPLQGLLGLNELLQESSLDDTQRRYSEAMRTSGESLRSIVDDALDLSQIEAGRVVIVDAPFDLRLVCRQLVDLLAPRAKKKGIALELEYPDDVPHLVVADAGRLRQVVLNLIDNAVKFTERGAVTVSARSVEDCGDRDRLRISVVDTGFGVPDGLRDSLFDAYVREEGRQACSSSGAGLGLAICRHLVQAMGGRIGFESSLAEGSTFWFEVALHRANREEVVGQSAPRATGEGASVVQGRRLLVAEDNPVNQMLFRDLLERLGCEVDMVASGRDAVRKASECSYDLILMDCQLPDLDGFMATGEIRKNETSTGLGRTPIVAVTAHALEESRDRCLAEGMDDFLPKPIELITLRETVIRWLTA